MLIKDLSKFVNIDVELKGWIYNLRSSGSLYFLQLRDGSGFLQAVVNKEAVAPEVWADCQKITLETAVTLQGVVSEHPKKFGEYELQVSGLKLVQVAEEYPIGKKEHGPDFLMEWRHLWLRSPKQWAILKVRDAVITAINEYLHQECFIKVDSPVFTPNACEGTTTLFPVPYFDLGTAYLSQSGQLYSEAAIASVGRCYDFGPVFRAEKSKTKRHLTEFWMMDAEGAFVEHEENLRLQEGLVRHIVRYCLAICAKELAILERDTEKLRAADASFTRLSYDKTIATLQALGSDIQYGEDLGNDDEALLTKDSPVPMFVEKWPKTIKPFYMKRDTANPELVLNDDLIATEGAGELIGGSQREDDYNLLLERIKAEGLNLADYEWYLDLRKYGSVPHSGFGIGLERTVRWITGVEHIRECIPFPRMITRLKP
ncbi:MAG: Asparagine-tRNA ligase [Candidatus Magasanikbacteria bacterium GW2011_GWC2_40_17]|uniref:Asparagine--tRNA ligase n=1 Tax=Candidatus Magasanikbacteria bacterium GW2011_GWA2_42_32 TaxID=1619039 RepID=A0A0G1A740_9BACT|nr:MAG: Asparagine-tRNA ligase [Candidatus Magasanikbacteria bacterium GW2011_GWC2_40_17]KKS56779.1 MAG: Asparagine-tRNA ligase [Candidatus Magasanikbacteria bacterium GW2011_GWA2_42_32]OGH86033.1 MAG: asparagine--tRNA ligase [Candidatus Magasanikbacteria bacterium RIFOXYB2_FULL_38_10]